MPKKNQKKEQKKPALQIVEEQKEPCLRALQKKVRNLNKKLTEIADLQAKKDLKPEQIQKIQRKDAIEQQKTKFLQFIEIYTDIMKENQKAIFNIQLNQVKDIAAILAVREYAQGQIKSDSNVQELANILSSPSSNSLTLNQRVEQITTHLLKVAQNRKTKEAYMKFLRENGDIVLRNEEQEDRAEQNVSQEKVQQKSNTIEIKQQEVKKQIQKPAENKKVEQKQEKVVEKEEVKVSETPEIKENQSKENLNKEATNKAEEKTEDKPEQGKKPHYNKRKREYQKRDDQQGRREFKPRHHYKGKDGEQQEERKNRTFKPKYAPKEEQPKNDDSSSESSLQVRQFKREERKQLEKDGFIIMGKKHKPKARDQKEWHDHQHGKKHHHHHTQNNY